MTSIAPLAPVVPLAAAAPTIRTTAWTAALVAGCAFAAAAPVVLAAPALATSASADADLVRLLRAMVAIKGALLVAAVAALVWRFRRPVAPRYRAAYVALPWAASAALGLMWTLSALWPATVVLHGAGIALLVVAAREPHFLPASGARS